MDKQLLTLLVKEKLLKAEQHQPLEVGSPWYVKVLLAFSGWLAASFFLGFWASLFSQLYRNTPALIGIGLILIFAAYFLLKLKKANEFLEHLALAISLAGQVLLVLAVMNEINFRATTVIFIVLGVMQLFLAIIMPNFVHRVFSSFFAVLSFAAAIYEAQNASSGLHIYSAFILLIAVFLWLNEFKSPKWFEMIQANAYGLVLALIGIKGTTLFIHTNVWHTSISQSSEWLKPWMGEVLLSAVTLYLVWKLLQRNKLEPLSMTGLLALFGTLFLTLLSLQAQGLILGVVIILLGFSSSNRVLLGLGVISLLFFISSYYYWLDNSLLEKSLTLLLLGLVLIFGYWLIGRLLPDTRQGERVK